MPLGKQPLEVEACADEGPTKTNPSQIQASRRNFHLSDSNWGECLLKFDLGLKVVCYCVLFLPSVHKSDPPHGWIIRMQNRTKTSRGNSHLSESDWGEFLLKFDLGPHVASLVMSTPLFVQVVHVWRGVNLCFHLPSRMEGPKLEHNFQPWDQNS